MKNNFFKLILLFLIAMFSKNSFSSENYYMFNADRIEYQNNKNTVIAEGNAQIYNQKGQKIFSEKINYNKSAGIIKTFSKSKFIDEKGNEILADEFLFNINTNDILIKGNVKIVDIKKNTLNLKNVNYNVISKKGFGQEFIGLFSDGSNFKSKKIFFNLDNGKSILKNTKYTTCLIKENNKENNCPWWMLSTSETMHDQKEKTISHKNALLKIRNVPVLYFPYLEHPDPTVKRKSGFMPPLLKSLSSSGKTLSVPYFWAISNDTDATITPIYYFKENPLLLGEFRKKFKNSELIIDSSYTAGYKNYDIRGRERGSRNHFYLNFLSNIESSLFDQNQIKVKIQKVSQENYLKVNQINTLLANEDDKKLENQIQFTGYNDNSGLDISLKIHEDLAKHNSNKYEYLFPYGNYSHNINKFNNNINFKSTYMGKKYESNNKSLELVNQIDMSGARNIFNKFGTSHSLKTRFTNINFYSKDNEVKSNESINNYFTVAVDNSIPLYKKEKNTEKIIIPRLFVKYTTGTMKDDRERDKNLIYADIYSMNRSAEITNPETGLSFGLGLDYEIIKKNIYNSVYLKNTMGIGQVLRTSELDQMPKKSSLNKQQSSFVGFYNMEFFGEKNKNEIDKIISFQENFNQNKIDLKYNFNLNKNLSSLDSNQFNLSTTIFNKINYNINFDEKNNTAGNERKLDSVLDVLLNKNFYLTAKIVENLKDNYKESERFGLNYENDCIKIGLFLKKEFYNNQELNNNKSLMLSVIIKPFANDLQPDLSSFIK